MIQTETHKGGMKEIKEREKKEKEVALRVKCEAFAFEKYTEQTIKELSNKNKGLWYLPILSEDGETIEKMAILKPIDRHILSYASTKIEDEGLYIFLEAAMSECMLKDYSDMEILNEDEYFIPAANKLNKMLEGKKAALLKR